MDSNTEGRSEAFGNNPFGRVMVLESCGELGRSEAGEFEYTTNEPVLLRHGFGGALSATGCAACRRNEPNDASEQKAESPGYMAESFLAQRQMLFRIAYRILGCVADADDMVQEVWLRWQSQGMLEIQSPRAWLGSAITRLCIDRLRSARHQREHSYGVCVPEPLMVAGELPPDCSADRVYSLAIAFDKMLEVLRPVERTVFLLREVFGYAYSDAAAVVGKDVANCRQIARRAKTHLKADSKARPPSEKAWRLVKQFAAATVTGGLKDLLTLLNEDTMLRCEALRLARRCPHATDAKIATYRNSEGLRSVVASVACGI